MLLIRTIFNELLIKVLYLQIVMMDYNEHITIQRLSEGEADAMDVLYMRYAPKVRLFALQMLKNPADAEDITHDVFLKIWEQRKNLVKVVSLNGYMFRMTRNAIINLLKRRQVMGKYCVEGHMQALENIVGGGMDYENQVTTDELLELVEAEIAKMPEQRRKVFMMSRYEDKTYNDIAKDLNISPKTVQYHISTALSDLKKIVNTVLLFAVFQ